MTIWWVLLSAVGAFAAYLVACFVVGFVAELLKGLGIQRKPKLRVIRYEEGE